MADGSAPLVHTDFGMVLSSFHPTKVFTAFLVAASTENLPEESAWTYLPPSSYTMARRREGDWSNVREYLAPVFSRTLFAALMNSVQVQVFCGEVGTETPAFSNSDLLMNRPEAVTSEGMDSTFPDESFARKLALMLFALSPAMELRSTSLFDQIGSSAGTAATSGREFACAALCSFVV